MSFILDALKKSELERQRQAIPGLVESGIARPRPRLPTWAIALCVLLGINLIVLSVVLMRGWMSPTSASQVHKPDAENSAARAPTTSDTSTPDRAPTAAADGAPPTAADKHFSPLDTAPVYAPEIPVSAAPGNGLAETASARQPPERDGAATRAVRRKDPVLTTEDYKANDEEVLPSINELNLTGDQALPELHLDVHVFATKAPERFVFINMRKYHEGATLQEGPTVERIRRDGVILDYQGLRFLLPRQ